MRIWNVETGDLKPSNDLFKNFIFSLGSSFLLNCTFVPISMIVTLEVVKVIQALFIWCDFELLTIKFKDSMKLKELTYLGISNDPHSNV